VGIFTRKGKKRKCREGTQKKARFSEVNFSSGKQRLFQKGTTSSKSLQRRRKKETREANG